ncbi:MAG: hypothetical protein Ct9H300mP1_18510 [Planctomycetaceae bacterium]|nr:MAG: hypothetical protein Ct9H300mP1_18510 [Planctomycetaceae bacterium]
MEFARKHDAIILFDAAYEAYITDPEFPFDLEIDGPRGSGDRVPELQQKRRVHRHPLCLYGDPSRLTGTTPSGERIESIDWGNPGGTAPSSRGSPIPCSGAQAAYSPEGQQQVADLIRFYLDNPGLLRRVSKPWGSPSTAESSPLCLVEDTRRVDSWPFF